LGLFSKVPEPAYAVLQTEDYSIASSATNSNALDTSMPNALAVCRLMTNSNLVACMTGRSAGFATEAVVRSPPDGYTILLVTGTNAINTTLYEKLSFNFNRDIASVAGIARVPELMVANVSVPAKTVPEFIAYTKANPSKLNMASGGIGTPSHMAGELFKMMTGVAMVHVPYRGVAPALTDLISGQVQVMFAASTSSMASQRYRAAVEDFFSSLLTDEAARHGALGRARHCGARISQQAVAGGARRRGE
jgi:hypothetical protein